MPLQDGVLKLSQKEIKQMNMKTAEKAAREVLLHLKFPNVWVYPHGDFKSITIEGLSTLETIERLEELVFSGEGIVGTMAFFGGPPWPNDEYVFLRPSKPLSFSSFFLESIMPPAERRSGLNEALTKVFPHPENEESGRYGVIVYKSKPDSHGVAETIALPGGAANPAAEEAMPELPDFVRHAAAEPPLPPTPDAVDELLAAVMSRGDTLSGSGDFAPMDFSLSNAREQELFDDGLFYNFDPGFFLE